MKNIIIASTILLVVTPAVSVAAVSDDLVFCSRLIDKAERVACYNAAARIAENKPQRGPEQPPRLSVTTSVAPPAARIVFAQEAAPTPRFDGFYAAGFVGYTFKTTAGVPPVSPLTVLGEGFLLPTQIGNADLATTSGAKILGAAFGYNLTNGRLLFGIETRGKYDYSKSDQLSFYAPTVSSFPLNVGCGTNPCDQGQSWEFAFAGKTFQQYQRTFGVDVSARFGITFGDWLFFSRVGAGIEILRWTEVFDDTSSRFCNSPIYAMQGSQQQVIGCGSISGGSVYKAITYTAAPYATFGLGLEANFDRYFARIEGEYSVHAGPKDPNFPDSWYYTVQMTGGVGIRF